MRSSEGTWWERRRLQWHRADKRLAPASSVLAGARRRDLTGASHHQRGGDDKICSGSVLPARRLNSRSAARCRSVRVLGHHGDAGLQQVGERQIVEAYRGHVVLPAGGM